MSTWRQYALLTLVVCGALGGMAGVGAHTRHAANTGLTASLPLILVQRGSTAWLAPANPSDEPRVYAPFFASADIAEDNYGEMAVFWLGRVEQATNYTDVRVAFSEDAIEIITATFDRRLWFDETPTPAEIPSWDSVSLLLSQSEGSTLDATSYRFDAQLSTENGIANQAAYRGGPSWTPVSIPFGARSGWRGETMNNDVDGRGWSMNYRIPFSSLGLNGAPTDGTRWRIAIRVHDRDDGAGTPIPDQVWPPTQQETQPSTWGVLYYGLPGYRAPSAANPVEVMVRQGLNGADVPDSMVGGGFDCGGGDGGGGYFAAWGNLNYEQLPNNEGARGDFNVQNQRDVADWPCFSKNYITFPLAGLPAGKQIVSAKLILHQFANSQPEDAQRSLIQVFRVAGPWNENTITWNTAPLAVENVGRGWADALPGFIGFPGAPREIDLSWTVAQAYQRGIPLQLVLYSADRYYHSGKYFISSDTGDWNAVGRPTLLVTVGDP
jgi:hypothetical protein